MANGVVFGVLGPLMVRSAGDELVIREPKRRAVLAALVLHNQHVVTSQRLIELVWGDHQPASTRKALHVYVSRLRRTIASLPGVQLTTHGDGYRLVCPAESIDLHRFRRLLSEARQAPDDRVRLALLRAALDLWRGPAFADAAGNGLHEWVAPSVTEERLAALDDYFAVQLRLAGPTAVLGSLTAHVAQHPTRERTAELLMTALDREGRPAEALRVFQRLRLQLLNEAGTGPGPRAWTLRGRIIDGTHVIDMEQSSEWPYLPGYSLTGLITRGEQHASAGDLDQALALLYAARVRAREINDEAAAQRAAEAISRTVRRGAGEGRTGGLSAPRRVSDGAAIAPPVYPAF
ncbi:BTAD domain-containing putative transcriptional regulator [Micromonospora sp. NPDC005189]|uniref:AfsR/SARP family transcriptional regulator n=1 Tax=unclassified Micromonospora TaxID=2617518 RepID=UPI0033B34B8B